MKKMHRIVSILLIIGTFFIVAVMRQYGVQRDGGDAQKVRRFPIKNQQRIKQKGVKVTQKRFAQHELANTGLPERTVSVGRATLKVELAQTPKEKMTGLSHRSSLAEGRGMLFLFKNEGSHSFWMKDTHFPIDMIWINARKEVVHIEHDVVPETFPQSFSSPIPALYVLEVPAGYAKNRITVGDILAME